MPYLRKGASLARISGLGDASRSFPNTACQVPCSPECERAHHSVRARMVRPDHNLPRIWNAISLLSLYRAITYKVVAVSELHGADFYRQRAGDMRRQAERAISPHLRETYLRIAVDWERMADEVRAKEAAHGRFHDIGPGA